MFASCCNLQSMISACKSALEKCHTSRTKSSCSATRCSYRETEPGSRPTLWNLIGQHDPPAKRSTIWLARHAYAHPSYVTQPPTVASACTFRLTPGNTLLLRSCLSEKLHGVWCDRRAGSCGPRPRLPGGLTPPELKPERCWRASSTGSERLGRGRRRGSSRLSRVLKSTWTAAVAVSAGVDSSNSSSFTQPSDTLSLNAPQK